MCKILRPFVKMQESLFSGKVTLTTQSGLSSVKVDIARFEDRAEIRLIDSSNIFSLFICSIGRSDFYALKRDQDILVEYDRFMQILPGLFHGLSTNKFTAIFNDGILRIMENSEFRNVCKLELKFLKPEETQYKRYLGDILSRMENDNIKLIKENSILRDKCINGDRELKDKIRYFESENLDLKRRIDLIGRDFSGLESKCVSKEEEISRLSNKIFNLEGENSQLRYDLEKYQKDNSESYRDQLRAKEDELNERLKDLTTANEIIRKLKSENTELKNFKTEQLTKVQTEADKTAEISDRYESLNKKHQALESKYKKLKEEERMKLSKIEELENSNKSLSKRLETAQNVYNHFYSKKVEENNIDNYSDTFSLRPESPPPH